MSRLVVKNLPKNASKELVQETFSQKGIVTDVQLKYTKDGKFRHFAFVGFKGVKDASEAMKYFDNTFINASRVRVELCAELGDTNKPKAWCEFNKEVREKKKLRALETPKEEVDSKKLQQEKTKFKEKIEPEVPGVSTVIAKALKKYAQDEHFLEFLKVHAGTNTTIWDNDIILKEDEEKQAKKKDRKKLKNLECKETTDTKQDSEEVKLSEEQNKVAEEKISDLEYMKRMTVKDLEETEEADSTETNLKTKSRKESRKAVEETDFVDTNGTETSEGDASIADGNVEESDTTNQKPPRIKMSKQKKEFKEMFTVKLRELPLKVKKKQLKEFFHPLKLSSIRIPPKIKGIAFVGFATEKEMQQALLKHRSFLGGKRIALTIYTDKKANAEEVRPPKWHAQEQSLEKEEDISESGRIFVRNLSYGTTEEDLEVLFHQFGDTTEVSMPVDRITKMSKGFAHVTYMMPEHAKKAFKALDGTIFNGRMLHLLRGKAKVSLEEAMMKDGLSYKAKKDLKQKLQSGSSHNWNSLFLGQNAVADVMAATYNTTKEHVLDDKGTESLAVRLALGETQIVTDTKQFMINHGVRLEAFSQPPKVRSKRVMLVKNLPAKTTESEITELFAPQGELQRVVLPPSGVTAIVEFAEPSEARTAFTRLAYTKFKNLPLYLEWAPLDTFIETEVKPIKETKKSKKKAEKAVTVDANKEPEDLNEPPEPETTLYVKNINFSTTEEQLKEHFQKCGTVHSVSIAYRKPDVHSPEMLSKGYGFVRFKKNACASLALKTLNNVPLQGHHLEISQSHRTVAADVAVERKQAVVGKQTGSKILVRNIPFQANYQEIKDLFKTFGELKAIRLPKKMVGTGKHRGFAFVEYESKSDAKRALDALCQSTHLYGRRLVLEWASGDDDISDLRKRTAEQFFAAPNAPKAMRPSFMAVDAEQMESYN